MSSFSYRATDEKGQEQQGTLDAASHDAALEALAVKGWTPVDVAPLSTEPFNFVAPTSSSQKQAPHGEKKVYLPIAATLRLYAGWLLAYYALVYALGWYAHSRDLPFEIPYVEALLLSPLVLSFTLAAFLFLTLHSMYQLWGKGLWKGILLSALGVGVFVVYRMNVV